MDFVFLSDTLVNFTVYLSKERESHPAILQNVSSDDLLIELLPELKQDFADLYIYMTDSSKSENCFCGMIFQLGASLSRMTINEQHLISNVMHKPACFDERNVLEYGDLSGTPLPKDFQGFTGLLALKYLSLESTGIESLPYNFTGYFPSLQVLKLGKLGIRKIIETADENFFGLCPTLREVYLDECKLTIVPSMTFSGLIHLQRIDLSNNFLQTFDIDARNLTELSFVNLRRNNLKNIPEERTSQLNKISRNRSSAKPLVIDLSLNTLSCQCSSMYFIKWLKHSAAENIIFQEVENYRCSYPNGSIVRLSDVSVDELEQKCSVMEEFTNASSDCPCDEDTHRRLRDIRMSLNGFFCKKDNGDLFEMKNVIFPSCSSESNILTSPVFIVPVVVGGILLITVL